MTMQPEPTALRQRIDSGKRVLIAEIAPPKGADGDAVRQAARAYRGKVHALGVSDNRDGVAMAALAAASIVAAEGIEPILHLVTRDRNRIALISECLGAAALGIRNLLCTTGTHQTLGRCRSARGVFDVDSVQLLRACNDLGGNGSLVGEGAFEGVGSICLGATASPGADPMGFQVSGLAKKIEAGAKFIVTQPVFDIERLEAWWGEVTRRGIHEKAAILAGISPLGGAAAAKRQAESRPDPGIPESVLERLGSKSEGDAQRAEGIALAAETIERLSSLTGLRGFEIRSDGEPSAALETLEKAGLGVD